MKWLCLIVPVLLATVIILASAILASRADEHRKKWWLK